MNHDNCLRRSELEIPFEATPREVPALRRIMRQHLTHWGLLGVLAPAQLCVSELVTNVIKHVGIGVPATLAVSMKGTNLHLEVQDPSVDQLPTLGQAEAEAEGGRGLALIDAMSEKWGVRLTSTGKATWCQLATALTSPNGHVHDHHVSRADELLTLYGSRVRCSADSAGSVVSQTAEGAVELIADLLHWIQAHGLDPENMLGKAQARFDDLSVGRVR